MPHQRPSSAKRGALSFHTVGSSTRGGCAGGGVAQAASSSSGRSDLRITLLLRLVADLRMRRVVVAMLRVAVRDAAGMPDFLADLRGAPRLAQPARRQELEKHRHEEDGKEGRREHAARSEEHTSE